MLVVLLNFIHGANIPPRLEYGVCQLFYAQIGLDIVKAVLGGVGDDGTREKTIQLRVDASKCDQIHRCSDPDEYVANLRGSRGFSGHGSPE